MESILTGTPRPVSLPDIKRQLYVASQWQLMWWRFSKHRVALVSGIIVVLIYVVALVPEVLAPYPPDVVNARFLYAPPQTLHLFATDGGFRLAPHVFGYKSVVDAAAAEASIDLPDHLVEGRAGELWDRLARTLARPKSQILANRASEQEHIL